MSNLEEEKVLIKNLPPNSTKDEVIKVFEAVGHIVDVFLPVHKKKTSIHVIGFITFRDKETADKAIEQFSGFRFTNSHGLTSTLALGKAFKRRLLITTKASEVKEADKASPYNQGTVNPSLSTALVDKNVDLELEKGEQSFPWKEEREKLLKEIFDNEQIIKDLEKKKYIKDQEDHILDEKEKRLLEEKGWLPEKIKNLSKEIEILQLQVKLKELQAEQASIK
ncbi:uncharacterized protein LOC5517065 isoform X1 [Nematostella vectensis]|uniref:uncharacterized protein LOC5517065 isoform X1 n=1 Tax=Nematostella vectensis TaxID=45351 RepID=UPI0020779023|nr:uncharacterized protein LOC5517065 isoform X1 [Nematostella vectensis]